MSSDQLVQALGGAAIAIARNKLPDWTFAALMPDGDKIVAYIFGGRRLEIRTELKAGAAPFEQFAQLARQTSQKSGLFRRKTFKSACVIVRRRGQKAVLRLDYQVQGAFLPLTENPVQDFHRIVGDTFPDEARAMSRDGRPVWSDASALVQDFIRDYEIWNDYAFAESQIDDPEARWNQRQAYDNLITRYCLPDKTYQGIAYGSDADHTPDQETIISVHETGDTAEVRTRFQDRKFDFITHDYTYELFRAAGQWHLQVLWLCDENGRYRCL
ncbi:hypothetical protein FNJ84_02030 [Paracoccus sp. M683]|uniref:hypothetical protein n=1 Tax=Paracoccus sp. M683 TaxID=2594268 RepID=UPI001180D7E3|nr:hypothetical protein [Paracoccus sp. M683]TRW99475.1 hypothetical protein FNJ84_02030 [Paracoccus sp. M683]